MYRGFNLQLNSRFKDEYHKYGSNLYDEKKSIIHSSIKNYVIENGVLDGSKIQDDWFPLIDADIFISHSRKDEYRATCLAGWLEKEMKLKCFIDSHVWGYADELIGLLDEKHSKISDSLYSYEKVLLTTSHVHMMLTIAITSMIDKTECLVFLNSPMSLSTKNFSDDIHESVTSSPWIFSELSISQTIRKKDKEEHRGRTIVAKAVTEGLHMEYKAPIHHLTPISLNDLTLLESSKGKYRYPLDIIYDKYKE